jgi:DNA-directed RNA polymerase subunit RPC12/RpoP
MKKKEIQLNPVCNKCNSLLNDQNWLAHHKEKNHYVCRICNNKRLDKYKPKHSKEKRDKSNINRQINRLRLRFETMLAYGNQCVDCGENYILFLVLDHLNDTGFFDNKDFGRGVEFYSYLRKMGYPGKGTQLQILCHNCNALKELQFRKSKTPRPTEKEVYIKQKYKLSKEKNKELLELARRLYEKLNS